MLGVWGCLVTGKMLGLCGGLVCDKIGWVGIHKIHKSVRHDMLIGLSI